MSEAMVLAYRASTSTGKDFSWFSFPPSNIFFAWLHYLAMV